MRKSLLDIQQEIRDLENKVKDISVSISSIYEEIDDFRNDDTEESIDYKMIQVLSNHIGFGKHPLDKLEDAYACQMYLEALLNLVQADKGSSSTVNRLVIIQWLLTQSRLDMELEELFKESLRVSSDTFGELVEILPKQYRNYFVVDALLVANICGQANEDVLGYIVNLCTILGVDKEQLRILSIIARGALKQDLGKMRKADLQLVLEYAKKFKHYLNAEKLLKKTLCSQRTIAVELPDSGNNNFKWRVKQQAEVEKGEVIATYKKGYSNRDPLIDITAPCSGTIFQFRNNCINYGIIALETDNKDSIKSWVLQQRR